MSEEKHCGCTADEDCEKAKKLNQDIQNALAYVRGSKRRGIKALRQGFDILQLSNAYELHRRKMGK